VLLAHKSSEKDSDLTMYDELRIGQYRIEKEKLVADFFVE